MFFMAVNKVRSGTDFEELKKIIGPHIQWIKEMISKGKIVQAGKWGNDGGMAIFKASDIVEAEKISNEDPLVKSGFVSVEVERFFPNVEIR